MARPVVTTNSGDLQGLQRTSESGKPFYSFKGIPFAEPPLGDLRFKAPVPVKNWSGVKDASKDGNKCCQLDMLSGFQMIGEEDCLYLNVYTPGLPSDSDKKFPVMVYIHGGGFRMGSAVEDEFGADFAVDNGVILVGMHYRLGILGFLSLDTPEVPGNAGLKDQHLALIWIKENIKFFGGDANNITLFGCSAGGASVEYHVLHKKSKNLFHRAIAQSGSSLCPWALNSNPQKLIKNVQKLLGITTEDPNAILKQLNTFESKDLLAASMQAIDGDLKRSAHLFGFAPVVEKVFEGVDAFLTESPLKLLESGDHLKIPTIYTLSRDEGSLFPMFYGEHIQGVKERHYVDYMPHLNLKNPKTVNEELIEMYQASNSSEKKQLNNFLSDLLFVAPINMSLKLRRQHESHNYSFIFSYVGNSRLDLSVFGMEQSDETQHGSEIFYLTTVNIFKLVNDKRSEEDLRVKDWMTSLFISYAKEGNPTSPKHLSEVGWKPINKERFEILDIDAKLSIIPFPWKERRDAWEKLYGRS